MKVAIVHYWLVSWRGGEKVIQQLLSIFPDADLFVHVADDAVVQANLPNVNVTKTFIHKLPFSTKYYQKYLPLMPLALEQLDLTGYDLVISSESGPAKFITVSPNAMHICYCHSPMRYIWDMSHLYLSGSGPLFRVISRIIIHYLKLTDRSSSLGVDQFVANSSYISNRIEKCYRRSSKIIHPPVAIEEFEVGYVKSDYYLYFGQLTRYKMPHLVVNAFRASGKKLIVVGEGELIDELMKMATPNIQILGRRPFNEVKELLSNARALIFPGVEDFGIVPVESLACGTPVIAYGIGGVQDTLEDGNTGIFFYEQTESSLMNAIDRFEDVAEGFNPEKLRAKAEQYSADRFVSEFKQLVTELLGNKVWD